MRGEGLEASDARRLQFAIRFRGLREIDLLMSLIHNPRDTVPRALMNGIKGNEGGITNEHHCYIWYLFVTQSDVCC
jgi:hypothetical protein